MSEFWKKNSFSRIRNLSIVVIINNTRARVLLYAV